LGFPSAAGAVVADGREGRSKVPTGDLTLGERTLGEVTPEVLEGALDGEPGVDLTSPDTFVEARDDLRAGFGAEGGGGGNVEVFDG
jgi:hypothetical protein